ncbi:unknown protein [Seminavis robusta]|uniref:Uncharacterized protein n=1 Tax=Seminavis robusta TaxID=568900 RepID=A0A9N8DZM2_9STRA|nr:unknown protein [Seminavis robusta]|eukprot:Sro418_g138900.1 n/a (690) ;mRNA; f:30029-32188
MLNSNSTNKDNHKSSSARGVSLHIRKQLAKDIHRAGGIEAIGLENDGKTLDQILKQKEHLYGKRGSTERRQVRNLFHKWKNYSPEKYCEQVVIPLVLADTATEDTASHTADSSFDVPTPEPTPSQIPPPKPSRTAARTKSIPSLSEKPKPAITKPASFFFEKPEPTTMSRDNSFTIKVNTERPEANREVMVYELDRIQGVGDKQNQLFSGFWIVMPIDFRYILDDDETTHWKVSVIAKNKLLLSIQAWNYSALHDRDEFKKCVTKNDLEAMDGAMHDLIDEKTCEVYEDRKWKHLILEFEQDVHLSTKEIYDNDVVELEPLLLPITVKHPKNPKLKYTSMFASWKVARIDVKARKMGKVGKKEKKSNAARQLEALMNGISIHNDDTVLAPVDSESEEEESEEEESEDEESEEEERMKICDIEMLTAPVASIAPVKPSPVFSLETVPKLSPVPQGMPSVLFAAAPTGSLAPNPPTRDTQEMTEELRKNSFKPRPSSRVSRAYTAEQRRKERRAEKQNQARLKNPTPGIDENFLQGLIVAADTSHEKTKEIMAKSKTPTEESVDTDSEADTDDEGSDNEDSVDAYRHARRMEKAHELLKEEKGGDIAWCDAMIADLEKFVSENEAGLDDLLAEDDINALLGEDSGSDDGESSDNATVRRKRSWNETSSDEETDTDIEMDGEELLEPPTKRK